MDGVNECMMAFEGAFLWDGVFGSLCFELMLRVSNGNGTERKYDLSAMLLLDGWMGKYIDSARLLRDTTADRICNAGSLL